MINDIKNDLKDKGWICPQGIYWNDLVKILMLDTIVVYRLGLDSVLREWVF